MQLSKRSNVAPETMSLLSSNLSLFFRVLCKLVLDVFTKASVNGSFSVTDGYFTNLLQCIVTLWSEKWEQEEKE